jgi:competence protein ComEA
MNFRSINKYFAVLFLTVASMFASATPVDINTADAETLAASIKGVGHAKAEAIVAYREKNGRFKTIEDLALVKGIGEKTVEANRDNLTAGTLTAPKK